MSLRMTKNSAEMKGWCIPFHSLHLLSTKRHTIMSKLYTRALQQPPPGKVWHFPCGAAYFENKCSNKQNKGQQTLSCP
jgi:hypothetical protein